MDFSKKKSRSLQKSLKEKSKCDPLINDVIPCMYNTEHFKQNFQNCWRNKGQPLVSDISENKGLKVISTPFNCAFIPNIIRDTDILQEVSAELSTLDLKYKNNDLFKFKCSEDLIGVNKPNIQKLCQHIKTPIKQWVQNLTGLPLNDKVAISCSKYEFSDILLCHDDELEGRRIAFILYLSPTWKKKYGGSLDLFSVDKKNRPVSIVERFYPQFNSLAFFEVSPVSFHQVAEVLVKNKTRLSVNGWFHGEPIKYPSWPILRSPTYILPGEVEEQTVYSWINPLYLDQNTQRQIRQEFQDKSEMQLPDFLKKKKYNLLAEELRKSDLKWTWAGPPNKRHVEVLNKGHLSDVVKEFLSLMHSEAVFLILSQLTGLVLHHLAPPDEDASIDKNDDISESDADSGKSTDDSQNTKMELHSSSIVEDDGPSTNEENGIWNPLSTKSSKKNREMSKGMGKKGKKRKHEGEKEKDDTIDETVSGIGGLIDGWESDMEGENFRKMAADRKREENMKAEASSEVHRWRWGAYSLMRDDDLRRNEEFVLDATMFCNGTRDWDAEFGGGTFYVAKGEDTELLTVLPSPNSLALIYRDRDTFRFTKHINVKSRQLQTSDSVFHEIYCEYREINKN